MDEIPIQMAFVGSCTNSRIEDMRQVATVVRGHKVAKGVTALIVPGSGLIKQQAETEGLDKVFLEAGFEWREPGCSMCLGMNPDKVKAKDRCASTSNRNFEGRQGAGARTHLMSPAMVAASAITGKLTDVRKFVQTEGTAKAAPKPSAPTDGKALTKSVSLPAPEQQSVASAATASAVGGEASAGMPKFTVLDSAVTAPFRRANCDTDCIIPKQFLKTIKRTGLGAALFFEIRFDDDGVTEKADFVLNKEPYRKATVLVALENFGCGSSREHAPWALNDFGIRCVIAPSFADIFHNNCFKNGMLPIALPKEQVETLMVDAEAKLPLTVDLPAQVIRRQNGEVFAFEVDPFRKNCLINGLDDIGLTLQKKDHITKFEMQRREGFPWLELSSNSVVEVKVSASKSVGFYVRTSRDFLSGLPATEDRPARQPANQVLISATGAAIDRAARTAFEVQESGAATITKISTDLIEVGRSRGVPLVPQVVITMDAPVRAKGLVPAVVGKAAGGGCSKGAADW